MNRCRCQWNEFCILYVFREKNLYLRSGQKSHRKKHGTGKFARGDKRFTINDYVPLLEVNSKTVITWPIVRNRCFFFFKE